METRCQIPSCYDETLMSSTSLLKKRYSMLPGYNLALSLPSSASGRWSSGDRSYESGHLRGINTKGLRPTGVE